jgi:aryl-alcohol dehydrogenase-like predicted oxidoreductase
MEYRQLGVTQLSVSELCLGTMQFGWTADEPQSFEILDQAFAQGINFFDTANIYSRWVTGNPGGVAESILGRWLKNRQIPRERIVIATKVRGQMGDDPANQGLSRVHILKEVEASLRRLQLETIDLYQAHWFDENVPIEETLQAFDHLIKTGKVRYIGCSNYPAWRLMQALWASDKHNLVRYDTLQPHYSLVKRDEFERELADVCRDYNIGVIPYSPLGGGFLTGKYRQGQSAESVRLGGVRRYFNERNWQLLDEMEAIGRAHGDWSISQVALAWQLTNPLINSPIIGPHTLDQLADNVGAVGKRLAPDEKERLDILSKGN